MPCTPIAESASRTSSNLNGLMIAVTSFICSPSPLSSERIRDERHEPVARPVLAVHRVERALRIGALVVGACVDVVAEVIGRARLPHRVRELVVVEAGIRAALVPLV